MSTDAMLNIPLGWTEYTVVSEKHLQKRSPPQGASLSDFLGVLGMPGQTAYWGITDVGKIKAGENVVVSGAAGAVGTAVHIRHYPYPKYNRFADPAASPSSRFASRWVLAVSLYRSVK